MLPHPSHTNTPPSPVPHRGVRGIVSTEPLVYSLPFYYLESTNVLRERQLQICSACGSGTSPPLFPLRLFGGKEEGGEVPLMPLEACCQSPENNHFSVITQASHLNRNHYRESFVYTRSSEVCTPRQPRAHIYEICRFANINARFPNFRLYQHINYLIIRVKHESHKYLTTTKKLNIYRHILLGRLTLPKCIKNPKSNVDRSVVRHSCLLIPRPNLTKQHKHCHVTTSKK